MDESIAKKLKFNLEAVLKDLTDEKFIQQIADEMVQQIHLRTKLGKGVDKPGGAEVNLKPLSESYKKQRKGLKKNGKLDESTSPAKSNLTKSGDMLKSLKVEVQGTSITIYLDGEINNKKAGWQMEQGRNFLNISDVQVKRLMNLVNSKIQENIKKNWS